MKIIILISLILGFLTGWENDKSRETLYEDKGSFLENTVPPLAIIFVIYSFFQSISFGFMAIVQILLGAFIANKIHRFFKTIRNK